MHSHYQGSMDRKPFLGSDRTRTEKLSNLGSTRIRIKKKFKSLTVQDWRIFENLVPIRRSGYLWSLEDIWPQLTPWFAVLIGWIWLTNQELYNGWRARALLFIKRHFSLQSIKNESFIMKLFNFFWTNLSFSKSIIHHRKIV